MAQKLSEYLRISPSKLERAGVFDAIIGIDSRLFVDPQLLRRTRIPEFRGAVRKMEAHFQQILMLLQASQRREDRAWREARRRLEYGEAKGVGIGYGVTTGDGRGIGPILAGRLLESADEIVAMGIQDPVLFELLGLFEEGIGADLLSDMTIRILQSEFHQYTDRVARTFDIENTTTVTVAGNDYRLPLQSNGKDHLVLLPQALLRDLPVALTRDDIFYVINTNAELRERVNELVGGAWKKLTKRDLRSLLKDPEHVRQLLESYKANDSGPYDVANDPSGLLAWLDLGRRWASAYGLLLRNKKPRNLADVEDVVDKIIGQFKRNLEFNGLNQGLYVEGKPRLERFSQLLFYAIADAYCEANDVDLNREPNAGNGPVDFKVSRGYSARVLVEIKLSSNSRLIKGYEKQLKAYEQAEATRSSYYVVVRVTRSEQGIKHLLERQQALIGDKTRFPKIVVIDATLKPSASRR